MPSYSYRAKTKSGEYKTGNVEAETPSSAAIQISNLGLMPLDIQEAKTKTKEKLLYQQTSSWKRFHNKPIDVTDIMLFSRQMSTLQKAGVPILLALIGLQESAGKKAFSVMLTDMRQSLDSGRDLSSTLTRYPKVFSDFYISMIRVGEMTGKLAEVFLKLYHYLQLEQDTKQRVKEALRYPIFVIAAITVAIIIVNIFVIPVFANVFESFNAPLPPVTRFLIGMSYIFTNYWWLLIASAAGAYWIVRNYLNTISGRLWWDKKKLMLPIAGPIILKTTLARFNSSLSMAIRAGVPMSHSLAVVAHTLDNKYLGNLIDDVRQNIERGESFYISMRKIGVFPPIIMQMISVGEETGQLDVMLDNVSEMYNRETEYEIKGLSAAIEPILLFFVAGMVLVLALGIFLPLWSLGQVALG